MEQFILLLVIVASGISLLCLTKIDKSLFVWLGFLVGLIIMVQLELVIIYFTKHFILQYIVYALMPFMLFVLFVKRTDIKILLLSRTFQVDIIIFAIIAFGVSHSIQPFFYSPDSYQFHSFIESLLRNEITGNFLEFHRWYVQNGRLIFLDILIGLGFRSGVEVFTGLFALMTVSTLFILIRLLFIYKNYTPLKQESLIFTCLAMLYILTVNNILTHSIYLHSNLMTGVFYSIGTVFLFLSLNKKENLNFELIGFIFLAMTIMIRKEMLLFSLFPITLYFLMAKYSLLIMYKYIIVYVVLAYQWFAFFIITTGKVKYSMTSHGSDLEYLLCFCLSMIIPLIVFIMSKFIIKMRVLHIILFTFYTLVLVGLLYYNLQETFLTIKKFIKFTIVNTDKWGVFWFILFASIYYLKEEKLKFFVLHMFSVYFTLRISLYVLVNSVVDHSSGDRIMIHISFFGLMVILYTLLNYYNLERLRVIFKRKQIESETT